MKSFAFPLFKFMAASRQARSQNSLRAVAEMYQGTLSPPRRPVSTLWVMAGLWEMSLMARQGSRSSAGGLGG